MSELILPQLRAEIGGVRTEVGNLRTEIGTEVGAVRTEIATSRLEIAQLVNSRITSAEKSIESVAGELRAFRLDALTHFDSFYKRFDRLDVEYQALRRGPHRLQRSAGRDRKTESRYR